MSPPTPPSPPLPPVDTSLPIGADLLRPNQDIQIHFWKPRPVFMQLNENLDPVNHAPPASLIYAPAFVNVFDENSGNFIETRRPKLEVGFTDPVEFGPWSAMTLRFRASRSRPPEPEAVPEGLPGAPPEAAPLVYPENQIVRVMRTNQVGSWFIPPLENSIRESFDHADANCISSQVTEPPGEMAILTIENPLDWSEGWNQITVRFISKARTAVVENIEYRKVTGMSGNTLDWTESTVPIHLGPATITLTGPTSGASLASSDDFTVTGNLFGSTEGDTIHIYQDGALKSSHSLGPGSTNNPFTFKYGPGPDGTHIISIKSTLGIPITGSPITYTSGAPTAIPAQAPPPPPTGPEYTVQWDPFDGNHNLNAVQVSETEVQGSGVITSNINITSAEFFLSSDSVSNLFVEVSLDGVNYNGIVNFSLAAYGTILIYYKIRINNNGLLTPEGLIALGAGLQIISGDVTTLLEPIFWDGTNQPVFVLEVIPCGMEMVDLTSLVRLQIGLTGNSSFDTLPSYYTNILQDGWLTEELTWLGFWDRHTITDLHVTLKATALSLSDDSPYIDIDALEVELTPYCPGMYPPPHAIVAKQEVILYPSADQAVIGWTPEPAHYRLQTPVNRVSSDYVVVDPRVSNSLVLKIQGLPTLPPVPSGYTRQWNSIQVRVQAQLICDTNSQCRLGLMTNYGPELYTEKLTDDLLIYSVQWDYSPGLTDDQMGRLYVEVATDNITAGTDDTFLYLYALEVVASYIEITTGSTPPGLPPPPPGVFGPITLIDLQGEVFSCGSLGGCTSPMGVPLGRISITNPSPTESATVSFNVDGMVHLRVFDTDTPATEYSILGSPLAGYETKHYTVYSWIGDNIDPPSSNYPVDARSGNVVITVTLPGPPIVAYQALLPWVYLGL
jgi:hypothetical protein